MKSQNISLPTVNQRIRSVIDSDYKGSVRAFCLALGFADSQKINRLFNLDKRNNRYPKPSIDVLELISNKLDISLLWLQTGEGQMLKDGSAEKQPRSRHIIRYWPDVDATAGGVELFDDTLTARHIDLDIPEFRDCTDAVNLYGDSMFPLYKSGQIILLKEWCENYIDFGNVYFVVTRNGNRMVKYLRKGSDDAHVLCVSENKDFDPFEIEKADILRLFLVKGGIVKNTL